MKTVLIIALSCVALFAGEIAIAEDSNSQLQGTWKGHELGPALKTTDEAASLIVADKKMEFHGADTNEWYKGTFSLPEDTRPRQMVIIITECPYPSYVGKKALAIYRLEGNTLTISGNEPGNSDFPASLDAPGARQFVFKKK